MKINNQKEIAFAMYGFFVLIFLDILFLFLAKTIFVIPKLVLYGIFLVILVFSIWRIITLKIFSLEVSEHICTVKYRHPLMNLRQPVLEVPIQKVISLKAEKGVINYILIIGVNTRRGIRNFYYRLGRLPENQNEKFKKISDYIASARFKSEISL